MICSVPDCGFLRECKGLCSMHYQRFRRLGSTDLPDRSYSLFCECADPQADEKVRFGECTNCRRRPPQEWFDAKDQGNSARDVA